ncbi:MAG: lysophospholipase [bacterium]|nr:lysophospholipase [bacterium]
MKRFVYILTLFLFLINTSVFAETKYTQEEIKAVSPDGFNMVATLEYPKTKGIREYQTVVLLHSLGYHSQWWGQLPEELKKNGYAVLTIDLRGHGKSVYNSKLTKTSWKNLTLKAYAKYPDDVLAVFNKIKEDHPKKEFFARWAIVGCDIGASTGVLAADKFTSKPKTIVMLSPMVKTKSLYIPVSVAQLDGVDFLAIISENNYASKNDSKYIMKFAQNEYQELYIDTKLSGMVMVREDEGTRQTIAKWVSQYLNQ